MSHAGIGGLLHERRAARRQSVSPRMPNLAGWETRPPKKARWTTLPRSGNSQPKETDMRSTTQPNTIAQQTNPIARDIQNVVSDAQELLKTVQAEGESRLADVKSKVN